MRLIIIIFLLLQVACVSKLPFPQAKKSKIPHAWLTKKSSIAEINKSVYELCEFRRELPKLLELPELIEGVKVTEPPECIENFDNPFKTSLPEKYTVYEYHYDKDRRYKSGWALIIDGVVVETIVYSLVDKSGLFH